jgi:cytochrome c oxidase cbb3-type subunit 4
MDINTFRGIVTGVLLVLFVWLIAWAWSKARRADFEAAARLPLEEEPDLHGPGLHGEGKP